MEILQGQFSYVQTAQSPRSQESRAPDKASPSRDTYTPTSRPSQTAESLYNRQGQVADAASKPVSEPPASEQVRELKPMVANPKLLSAAQQFVDIAHFEADMHIVDIYV